MVKREIEAFLLAKQGYLKKSPFNVAKALWKNSNKHSLPKNKDELYKEIKQIRDIQANMRLAETVQNTTEDDFLLNAYNQILAEKNKPKRRIFFDIEVSPNIVFSWRIGGDISLSHDNIIEERAIICICWKFEGESKVHSLEWNKGDDKQLLEKFAKIIDGADEVIGQNSDQFDIKWLRTRCIYHNIPVSIKFNSLDTLKMARAGFKLNCNKLDYMGQFLGLGKKIKTDYDLWKDIVLGHSKEAMTKMVDYCKQDVVLLEQVYEKLQKYSPVKKFRYKI